MAQQADSTGREMVRVERRTLERLLSTVALAQYGGTIPCYSADTAAKRDAAEALGTSLEEFY